MTIWIVIADASQAKLFAATPPEPAQLIREFSHPKSRAMGKDLLADRPGRVVGRSGTGAVTAIDSQPKEEEARVFAIELAKALHAGTDQNAYHALAIVAAPHFLGMIREHINPVVRKHLKLCINKDYLPIRDPRELTARIQGVVDAVADLERHE
jgi:protein required for attachment to host cells